MSEWQQHPVYTRKDGSYVVIKNGFPYHVPHQGEWAELWAEVHAWAQDHPEQVEAEPLPPDPTPEELRQARMAEIQARFGVIDAGSIRSWRAWRLGTETEEDLKYLAEREKEAAALRDELAGM